MKIEEIAMIYDKTLRVIASCETEDHLACARKFVDAANNFLVPRTESEFAQECRLEMYHHLRKKEAAIMPQQSIEKIPLGLISQMVQYPQSLLQSAQKAALSGCANSTTGNPFGRLF